MERLARVTTAKSVSGAAALEVVDLKKSFGGLVAVGGASFTIPEGKITALIGPNGAGKTTIFNMITGMMSADSGKVILHGQDITGQSPVAIARRGMARSFQDVRLCERMTVLDNVAVAVPNQPGESILQLIFRPVHTRSAEKQARTRAMNASPFLGWQTRPWYELMSSHTATRSWLRLPGYWRQTAMYYSLTSPQVG